MGHPQLSSCPLRGGETVGGTPPPARGSSAPAPASAAVKAPSPFIMFALLSQEDLRLTLLCFNLFVKS